MPISKDDFERLSKRIDGYENEMIEFQKELTAKVALGPDNGGRGEWERARFLIERIKSFGLTDISEFNAPDERVGEGNRPNLVVRRGGKLDKPAIWVMAHMDIVPAGDEKLWDTNPHQAVVKDGKIYGRGTEDNQQGLVSALFALKAFVDEGIDPGHDCRLLLVSDEETGNRYGIDFVLEKNPGLVKPEDIVIVPDSGNPDGTMVEIAEKSIMWARIEVRGKQVHASEPHHGTNAARAAANLQVRLDSELHQKYSRNDPVFDPPESTFEPTRHDANVPNVNTIPGKEVLYFDCRILPDYDTDEVIEVMQDVARGVEKDFGVEIEISQPMLEKAAPATSTDAPVVELISNAIKKVRAVEPQPMGIGGGTVAAIFRRYGIPAVVWSTMDDLAHQPNEYCVIDNLVQDAKVFAHLFLE